MPTQPHYPILGQEKEPGIQSRIDHPALECLIWRDNLDEAFANMTGPEQVAAFLRGDGKTDDQIAKLLGITPDAVRRRIDRARRRIRRNVPELDSFLAGRER